jgi:hypothetical protein
MPAPLSGPGLGLQPNQALYPPQLYPWAPEDTAGCNKLALQAGDTFNIPAGDWYINSGMYSIIQFLDPATGVWSTGTAPGWGGSIKFVKSDGFNYRLANLLGCPISASITAAGAGLTQGTVTITPSAGNSTWVPVVGGALSLVSITSAGAGYGIAPLAFLPPPPPGVNNANGVGGVPASGYCVISGGSVSGFTLTNVGAGYQSAFTITTVPCLTDPNLNIGITNATITFSVYGAGSLTAALCTNPGAPLATLSTFSLTVGGVGSGTAATLAPNILQTITTGSVTTQGTGFGASNTILLTTAGGAASAGSITNPDLLHLAFRPRPAQITLTTNAGGTLTTQNGTILDGGLFLTVPSPVLAIAPNTGSIAGGTIALTMGYVQDVVTVQQAP